MGLFDFFKTTEKTQPDEMAWVEVAGKIAGTIWHLLQNDPKMLASPLARVLLRDDWNVGLANSQFDPEKVLGAHDITIVFLREDQVAYDKWVGGLKTDSPTFQQIETEQFAKTLTRKLRERVEQA